MKMSKPLPLHVQDWEAGALAAGVMTQKRVPLRSRWKPRDQRETIVTPRPFARAPAGALFWVAETYDISNGYGRFATFQHVNYGSSPLGWTKKDPQVSRWQTRRYIATEMTRGLSRMTIEVVDVRFCTVIEISDADVEAEGMLFLSKTSPRLRFYNEYLTTFGAEFTSPGFDCALVRFKTHMANVNTLVGSVAA